ncbi:glycoside hydrolase family 1 protein [Lactococcus allomyrinae]|uniref:Glycoside hydrolase family 1 protein n=1 Tax=Lactococcus allomyrinae TaxID=2419773 RepID=A0A387BH98_9LACT|nr:glycoside hydrolase family 1 protein [Lactococcus allomyrinae]AYG00397.1 glycoside hydrolase family 1 protein [Lactococcus allomyrinae]
MNKQLPKGFFWGNSTSSMQTEGGWNEGGKGLSVYDTDKAGRNAKDWQVTVDHFHDYTQDFDLMKSMNMNMYRFQISWSRIVPDGDGAFNEEGIAFYSQLIDDLLARGIEPMICLYHFDMPLALAEKYNGFLSRHVKEAFVRFGQEMMRRFAPRVNYWIVFNEHNLYFADGFENYSGVLKKESTLSDVYTVFHHTMLAHCELTQFLHENFEAKIGGMLAATEVYPASISAKDNLYVRKFDEFYNRNLCDVYAFGHYSKEVLTFVNNREIDMDWQAGDEEILNRGISDFISFSYYRSVLLDASQLSEEDAPNSYLTKGMRLNPLLVHNEWGWSIDPEGFRGMLGKLYHEFGLPVFPIENGIGQQEIWDGSNEIQDDLRISYHRKHLQAMCNAIFIDGVEVLGYLGWGLIDIPASSGQTEKRYGAVYVDYETQQRIPKKSFHWFKKVFLSNGSNLE